MKYDFDEAIDRRGTDAIKWSTYPEDVIPLWVADMDFRSAEPIVRALQERAGHGVFGYTAAMKDLKRVLLERLNALYRWPVKPEQVLFVPGVVTGLNVAIQAYAEKGEGVLAQPPVYFHFLRDPVQHGRALMDPPLVRRGDTYEIDFDRFEAAIAANTRIFILCNPHNPVGRVFSQAELERIAEICLRHRLIICADEIHCDLVYSGCRHIPIATLSPEVAGSAVTLMAPSKTYNIAGLECAYAIIPNKDLRHRWQGVSSGIVPGVGIMGYAAAFAALRDGEDWLQQVLSYLQDNRDFLAGYLGRNMPAIQMCRMEGTYLAWLDCLQAGIPGNPAEFFLREARVGLNKGADFGQGGEGYVRLNFACPRKLLAAALDRMASALAAHKHRK